MYSLHQATKGSHRLEPNQGHCRIGCALYLMDVATTDGSFCRRSGLTRTANKAVYEDIAANISNVSGVVLHYGGI